MYIAQYLKLRNECDAPEYDVYVLIKIVVHGFMFSDLIKILLRYPKYSYDLISMKCSGIGYS